jgi:NADP-dependent 3-hydroxy acid dehydrogenase YdfG
LCKTDTRQTHYKKPYPAIDPTLPELSQQGRTVLICGGSAGIGHAIARNFCVAGAASVIILARRPGVLQASVKALADAYPGTVVSGMTCDVFEKEECFKTWNELAAEGVLVDVLVWSAVGMPALQPLLEQGTDRLWEDFEKNVRAPIYWVEKLYKQPGHSKQKVRHSHYASTPKKTSSIIPRAS